MRSKAESNYARLPLRSIQTTDILVAGGGLAGVFAALGAAAEGAAVTLVEQHGFLGGQGTAGGVHTFCGETQTVSDPWREMLNRLASFHDGIANYDANADGRAFDREALKFVLQEMLTHAGVRLVLHTSVIATERLGARVGGVTVHNKSGLTRIEPLVVIDATGDADLVAGGGWPFNKGGPVFVRGADGRVALASQSESLQLPMSLYFAMVDTGSDVESTAEGFPTWMSDADLPMISVYHCPGYVLVKMKVISYDATDASSLSKAEQAARFQMHGLAHHLRTKGYLGRRYPRHTVAWAAPHIGVREGRRIQAMHPLTIEDLLAGRRFPDAVAVGSYHVDYHWPTDARRNGTGLTFQVAPYQIPLRAMRPEGSENLLVPGRCMGGQQLAMSSYRVMGICAQTGFGAGTAAAVAVDSGCSLDNVDIAAIQGRLRKQGVRLDLAPYSNYLRARRATCEVVHSDPHADIRSVTLLTLPDNTVLCAWIDVYDNTPRVMLAQRDGEEWRPRAVELPIDEPASAVRLRSSTPQRLFGFGPSIVQASTEEGAIAIYLDLTLPAETRTLRSDDGGTTWVVDRSKGIREHSNPTGGGEIAAVPYPGDVGFGVASPRVRLAVAEVRRLEYSLDEGATWRPGPTIDDAIVTTTPYALEAIPAGIGMVYGGTLGLTYRVVPYNAVLGDAPRAATAIPDEVGRTWVSQYISVRASARDQDVTS